MCKIIGFANQKGGVGKTLTASTVAAILNKQGYRLLSVSADPQRNLDMTARIDNKPAAIPTNDLETLNLLHVLKGECSIEEAIVHTDIGDLLRASTELSSWTGDEFEKVITKDEYWALKNSPTELARFIENRFNSESDKTTRLLNVLQPLRDKYDYIIIDTNPSLGILTTNALCASDYIVIPAFAEATSSLAVIELINTIRALSTYVMKKITILGILMTKYEGRLRSSSRYIEQYKRMSKQINIRLFKTRIRKSARAQDYIDAKLNLLDYDPKGTTTCNYIEFVKEMLAAIEEEERRTELYG